MMDYILQAYHDTTSVRSLIEGERNLQGFMNAYLSLNTYYLTAPEVELSHGYCDFFLMPDLTRWPMVKSRGANQTVRGRQESATSDLRYPASLDCGADSGV